ncbi:putative hydroxyacylglutathione hydrolase [Microcystis aeruginosa PCC 9443]|uniref:Putative hydroxyacylglutathione hydrolase n=1 Tax=Microcystis aeruginosa PCC 9443 TaxID=1160281 RepID=I4G1N6_MICAE|nr:putative hydroxyacylglutathione hydrolase [Microcystis aeruginosa PCC 9443]
MSYIDRNQFSATFDIAIIGGGFSGSLVTANLLRDTGTPLSIALIERRKPLGTGIAYGTRDSGHLLNIPAGKMSAFEDDPEHFLHWLADNGYRSIDPASFVPRLVYGKYIRSILEEARDNAIADHRLETFTDAAIDLVLDGEKATITLKGGKKISAAKVVLALGNFPATVPQPLALLNSPYLRDAWQTEALADLKPDGTVLLVGTGLTMVDMVVSLAQRGFAGKIQAVSRHGLIPRSHRPTDPYPPFLTLETAPQTARGLLGRIRAEVKSAESQGHDWRAVLNALRPISQGLWHSLPIAERARFLRHLKAYWEVLRHRVADEIAGILDQAVESGQLTYHAGRIETAEDKNGCVEVTIRQRGTGNLLNLPVDRIINCTGASNDYRTITDPLVVHLRQRGLIRPHPLGCGIETADNGAILRQDGTASPTLYTLGNPRKGDLWETTAIPELRLQAAELARDLLRSLKERISLPAAYSIAFQPAVPIFRQLFDRESSTYTYLIADSGTGEAILIDPVLEQVDRDRQILWQLGLTLRQTMETHVHADHITGAHRLRELTNCSILFPENAEVSDIDGYVRDGDIWLVAGQQLKAIATPGHTDSHIAYLIDEKRLLTGDALLIRGCGRTDFQNGSPEVLYKTVTEKLFTLPDDTLVYPCHDYLGRTVSSIGEEKRWNPRFAGRDREDFVELMNNLNLPYPKKMTAALSANARGGKVVFVMDYQI